MNVQCKRANVAMRRIPTDGLGLTFIVQLTFEYGACSVLEFRRDRRARVQRAACGRRRTGSCRVGTLVSWGSAIERPGLAAAQSDGRSAYPRESSDTPSANAFCRVAPSVRLSDRAIFLAGVFSRARLFSSRTSCFVQSRRLALFVRFAIVPPLFRPRSRNSFHSEYQQLNWRQVLARTRRAGGATAEAARFAPCSFAAGRPAAVLGQERGAPAASQQARHARRRPREGMASRI
jgi:hypothetical protein